ncbi:MAG: alpha/beta fold hydrolase [Actinomycetota bacterium]|nr:alpha/beta fold hydrolase [Actinomycetota bacterium]
MPGERTVQDADGLTSVVFRWPAPAPQAGVQILHGWCEHALRYDRLANQLAAAGFSVYADDHRGHGQSGVRSGTLGDLGPRGMAGVVDAVHAVSGMIRAEDPGRPLFVLGHSWGSFILQEYLRRWGGDIDGALLTGTTRPDPSATIAAPAADAPAPRTAYDWLSRDDAEVDKYIADPLCGFDVMANVPATELFSLLEGDDSNIPTTLPVFIFNGADDPVGGEAGGRRLFEHYQALGLTDVSFRAYPGARHELFNETNRDEVVADVLEWLSGHL